jgi:sugar lactone lactonase YvrE
VQIFNSQGVFERVLPVSHMRAPVGLCISPDQRFLAIANSGMHSIKMVRLDGGGRINMPSIGEYGSGDGQMDHPMGVCFSHDGALVIVADTGNCRIQVFDTVSGAWVKAFRMHGVSEDSAPSAVCVDSRGYILVEDQCHVQVFTAAGNFVRVLMDVNYKVAGWGGVAVDPTSNVAVAVASGHQVQVL